MSFGFLFLLVVMFSVVAVLFTGLGAMLKGGDFNRKYGNKLMVARVVLQALAILTILILVVSK